MSDASEQQSRFVQQNALASPESSIIDSIFNTHRVINIAIVSSLVGMVILLYLTYLMQATKAAIHLGILALIMFLLCGALLGYKILILNDSQDQDKRPDHNHSVQAKKGEEEESDSQQSQSQKEKNT